MANKFNPFKPNHPIYTGLFAGRYDELKKIDDALYQTSFENPTNILFLGERGIGKTSLLLLAKYFAKGDIVWEDKKHNFITLQLSLNSNINLYSFIVKFKNILKRELHKTCKSQKVIDDIWKFVKKVEISGSKINETMYGDEQLLLDDFVFSLIDTVKSITTHKEKSKDGILVLIDEADTASPELNLGALIKTLSESLVSEGCNKVLFILTGLPTTTECLRNSHESSLRLFEELTLSPLELDDVKFVIERGISEINKISPNQNLSITDEAIKKFHNLSEGYPHFLQQLGYSTIASSENNPINKEDVSNAMFSEGGALELIGKRYYVDLFYNKINVDSYRQILTIMADNWNKWISKQDIRKKFTGSGSNLTNGLSALRKRNIILSKRGVKGQYRLQWLSFAFWIKIHKYKR